MIRTLNALLVVVGLLFIIGAPPVEASGRYQALNSAGKWAWNTILSYHASQAVDWALGRSLEQQLEERIPVLVSRMSEATGPERQLLQEELELHNRQLDAIWTLLHEVQGAAKQQNQEQQTQIEHLKQEQELLNRDAEALFASVERLEARVNTLDSRVDRIDERLELLESSYQSACLDLRHADLVGANGYRIQKATDSVFSDQSAAPNASLSLMLHLNACTYEMTERGLLIRVSMITRDLDRDLSLFITFKHLQVGGLDPTYMNHLSRLEYPLSRPVYRLDGQVREFFLPYAEIPFTHSSDRLAMAIVITHDGRPLYNSGDLVLQCMFSQRTNCRWR